MSAHGGRALAASALSVLLAAFVAIGPATALTVTAQWQAKLGPGGVDGSATLRIYLSGTGSVAIGLKGLAHSTVYAETVSKGTCAKPSTTLLALPPVKTTSTGTAARTNTLTAAQATLLNKAGEIIRLVAGTHVFCGAFVMVAVPAYVAATAPVGAYPDDIAIGFGYAWVTNPDASVSKISLATSKVAATIQLGSPGPGMPYAIAAGEGAVWVVSQLGPASQDVPGAVVRLDPATDKIVATILVGKASTDIALSPGAVWVTNTIDSTVSRVDPSTNMVVATIPVVAFPTSIAFGNGGVWVVSGVVGQGTVSRIDPVTNKVVATIPTSPASSHIAASPGAIWVTNTGDGTVSRIDPVTNKVVATINVALYPVGVAADDQSVWVGGCGDATLLQINAQTNVVTRRIPIGSQSTEVAVRDRSVWVIQASLVFACYSFAPGKVTRINY